LYSALDSVFDLIHNVANAQLVNDALNSVLDITAQGTECACCVSCVTGIASAANGTSQSAQDAAA
jgi:hypothetical protein